MPALSTLVIHKNTLNVLCHHSKIYIFGKDLFFLSCNRILFINYIQGSLAYRGDIHNIFDIEYIAHLINVVYRDNYHKCI